MRKIAQIEFYESQDSDSFANSIVRLYDEQGNLIHGEDFPEGFNDLISEALTELRYVIGSL